MCLKCLYYTLRLVHSKTDRSRIESQTILAAAFKTNRGKQEVVTKQVSRTVPRTFELKIQNGTEITLSNWSGFHLFDLHFQHPIVLNFPPKIVQ